MAIHDLPAQADFSAERPRSQILYDSEAARVVLFNLRTGQTVPPHVAPVRVLMLVIEGRGEFVVGEEALPVGPGSLAICEPNESHGFTAAEDLSVLAVIAPRPS